MKLFKLILLVTLLFAATISSAQDISGYWKGELTAGNQKLALAFQISKEGADYKSTMDVSQQGVFNLPLTSTTFDGVTLNISIAQMNAGYEGKFIMNSFIGKFTQNGVSFDLTLTKGEKTKFNRPQNVVRPLPYHEEEVRFVNPKENITLVGTLTTPQGNGPFPAVVLISGSGAQDRNEELFDHKPFEVIADYFTRNGIAVLRYDDRGAGLSDKGKAGSNTLDLSYDAEAAFDYLKSCSTIDHSKIGLLGHSEGGIINYMIAERRNDVAFLISLGGPAVKGSKLIRVQQNLAFVEAGMTNEQAEAAGSFYDKIFDRFDQSSELDDAVIEDVRKIMVEAGLPTQASAQVEKQICSPWMYYFLKFDPTDNIIKVNIPALLLNGNKDVQVASFQNIPAYKKIAEQYGKTNMTIRELPGLNHLFQQCNTGSTREYATIEQTISTDVLKMMTDYIKDLK